MRRDHEERVDVMCPVPLCGREFGTLSGLRSHFDYKHPEIRGRQRSLLRDLARRAAGWWGVRP
ncbi:MAG TPA: hypothetical protein VGG32_08695 [Thermoplasmata archaeon]|jgi:hypothetical protein